MASFVIPVVAQCWNLLKTHLFQYAKLTGQPHSMGAKQGCLRAKLETFQIFRISIF